VGKPKKDPINNPAPPPEPLTGAGVEIRDAIKNMSGFENEEQLAAVIPESTATTLAGAETKRKRRTKAEMEAAKGGSIPSELENDPRYKKAVNNMSAFGGAKTVKAAFAVTGKPLDEQETSEVDDYFYVISRKFGLDATKSGLFLSIYAVFLMLRLIVTRMMGVTSINLWSQFSGLFGGQSEPESETEQTPAA
jgi:hypothetical protein